MKLPATIEVNGPITMVADGDANYEESTRHGVCIRGQLCGGDVYINGKYVGRAVGVRVDPTVVRYADGRYEHFIECSQLDLMMEFD